jgi:hypothetical protein
MNTALTLATAPSVPAPLATVALAMRADSPVAGVVSGPDLAKEFNILLSRAVSLLGHRALQEGLDLALLSKACADLVHRRFRGMKLTEIAQALDRGAAGDYVAIGPTGAAKTKPDEMVYVNLPNVTAWLTAYNRTTRHEAVQVLQKADRPIELPPPPRDIPAEISALVQQAIDSKLPDGDELDFGNVRYSWLKQYGCLRAGWWPDEVPDFEALKLEEAEAMLSERPKDFEEQRSFVRFADVMASGKYPANSPLNHTLEDRCKKRTFREWLMQHAMNETDMPTLLAQHLAFLSAG